MNSLVVDKTIVVDCSKEKLWKLLTESEYTKLYMFNCEVDTTWKVGDPILWSGEFHGYVANQKGTVLVFEPFDKITYTTFDPNFGLADEEQNYIHVTYELSSDGDKTQLLIHNETFDGSEERIAHVAQGWDMVMGLIKSVAEES